MKKVLYKNPTLKNCRRGLATLTAMEVSEIQKENVLHIEINDCHLGIVIKLDPEQVNNAIFKASCSEYFQFNYLSVAELPSKPKMLSRDQVAQFLNVPVECVPELEPFNYIWPNSLENGNPYYLEDDICALLKESRVVTWIRNIRLNHIRPL